ncbi:MAG: hypothetical protein AB1540_03200 [Bdellovibrionota bacterium]
MLKNKSTQTAAFLALLALFFLSLNSLVTFPDSYDDEGFYGAYGLGYVTTGKFSSPSIQSAGPFALGNAWNSRVSAAIFGALGHLTGHSLATARSISFVLVWLAVFIWYFISRRLGISGWVGALFFASAERVFYSSHVFRPEATLVLMNTIFIYIVVRFQDARLAFTRGLLNGGFVLAHGTGLVTAVLNTFDFGFAWLKALRKKPKPLGFYIVGSILAVAAFYFIQIHDVGGYKVAQEQLQVFKQYQIRTSILEAIKADIILRWGTELIEVGGSVLAKVFRWYFYLTVLLISAFSAWRFSGLPKRLGFLSLGCVFTYMVIVPDKIDIQIAEMIPFFVAAAISGLVAIRKSYSRIAATLILCSLIAVEALISVHHAIKYRGPTGTQAVSAKLSRYLGETKALVGDQKITVIEDMRYWFEFKDRFDFRGSRYIQEFSPYHGVIVVARNAVGNPAFRHCKAILKDAEGYFVTYRCP